MSSITFATGTAVPKEWLQDINDFFYTLFASATTAAAGATALGLGTANTVQHAAFRVNTATAGSGKVRILDSTAFNIELTNTDSNTTNKTSNIVLTRYTTTEAPLLMVRGVSTSTEDIVSLGGGGTSPANATEVRIYTGTRSAVGATGTIRLTINSTGQATFSNDLTVTDDLFVVGHGTTASAANAFLDSGTGELLRSTSSLRYKADPLPLELSDAQNVILKSNPISFLSTSEKDDPNVRFMGLAAEEMHELDPRFVTYMCDVEERTVIDAEGGVRIERVKLPGTHRPDGVQYAALITPLIKLVQDQEERIKKLEAQVAQLIITPRR